MFNLRELKETDLEMVLQWRNREDVRKNMYTQHIITWQEHTAWFQKAKDDDTKKYLLFQKDDTPLGFVSFTEIHKKHKTAFWAFYSADPTRRGIGSQMEVFAIDYAFEVLQLEKLNCEVLSFNYPIVSFHRKHGFRIEGIFKNHFLQEGVYTDIYRLALFKKDWIKFLQKDFHDRLEGKKTFLEQTLRLGAQYVCDFSLTQNEIAAFAEVTKDYNPIHIDNEAAVQQGFKGSIAHGFLVGAVFSRILGCNFPGEGTIYLEQTLNFRQPVFPDELLSAQVKIITIVGRRITLSTSVYNSEKQVVLDGEAVVQVPLALFSTKTQSAENNL